MKNRRIFLVITLFAICLCATILGCSKECKHENVIIDNGVAATCTTDGLTEGKRCADCDEVLQPQTVIPAGHKESELIVDLAADCTNKGSGHKVCTVCNSILEIAEIPFTGHKESELIVDLTADCTNKGSGHKVCTACGEILEITEIPAVGHGNTKTEITNYIEATCKDLGSYFEAVVCADCGTVLSSERKTVPMKAHSESEWIIDVEADCVHKGSQHKICSVCGTILEISDIVSGHRYTGTVVQPHGEEIGYTKHLCVGCGDEYSDSYDYGNYTGLKFNEFDNYSLQDEGGLVLTTLEVALILPSSVSDRGGVIAGNYFNNESDALNYEIFSDGRPRVYFVKDGRAYDYVFETDVRGDGVVHLAFVFKSNEIRLYIDGEKKESKTVDGSLSPVVQTLRVGADLRETNTPYFKGTILSLNAFSEAREAYEIQKDILSVDCNENNLTFRYCFTDKTHLHDYSVNKYDLSGELNFKVGTATELYAAAAVGAKNICITDNIVLDRTVYFVADTTLYSESEVTITRASNFGGDMFVIGENSSGRNLVLDNVSVGLHIGKTVATDAALIIDGNADNMTVDVTGTALFICYSAVVDIYENVTIKNCFKVGNEKSFDSAYFFSYPERVGGAMAIVASGALNIYGGIFENNISGMEDINENPDSYLGGAIYNYANLNIYGGQFIGNKAYNGGIAYNYRMTRLLGGTFLENHAYNYGGAFYQANSQYAELIIGDVESTSTDINVTFSNNTSVKSGGAIFTNTSAALIMFGNAEFVGNKSLKSNGGAINVSGTITARGIIFKNNEAYSKGGAIYAYYNDNTRTPRIAEITNCTFSGNAALRGGAIGFNSADDCTRGVRGNIKNSEFINNQAKDMTADGSGKDIQGGALYLAKQCIISISNSRLTNNSAGEGGAIFGTNSCQITITESDFVENSTLTGGNGGAISLHSCVMIVDEAEFNGNSGNNGGAVYISYLTASTADSDVAIRNSNFNGNNADNHGGAIYVTSHIENSVGYILVLGGSHLTGNTAVNNGGAVYVTGSRIDVSDTEFAGNSAQSASYGGGALYFTGGYGKLSVITFTANSAKYGGAIALYSASRIDAEYLNGSGNTANTAGGMIYSSKSTLDLYQIESDGDSAKNGGGIGLNSSSVARIEKFAAQHDEATAYGGVISVEASEAVIYGSDFLNNNANNGGAVYCAENAAVGIYFSTFKLNTSANNGGALYVYTNGGEVEIAQSKFLENTASNFGGVLYVSNKSVLSLSANTATGNSAASGGFMYETTSGTTVTINGLTVSDNTAVAGAIIYGNTTGAKLNINKENYEDLDVLKPYGEEYWASAIVNKLTVIEINDGIGDFSYEERVDKKIIPVVEEEPKIIYVEGIFELAENSSEGSINQIYDGFPRLNNSSNFMSLNTTEFENVNGRTVSVDSFVYRSGQTANNPSFGEGILILQTMEYKKAHPDKEVNITITSFHFSVQSAVCINRNSRYFGYMRNLEGIDYDEFGFVRISYLLVTAASMGIHVTAIGQVEAYPKSDRGFIEYFNSKASMGCDTNYVTDGRISDYLNCKFTGWTSYGDYAATDMMHTKVCTVSNYIDMDGNEHAYGVWMSCQNLDGINGSGTNGHTDAQTAVIITNHEMIYRVTLNYVNLLDKYSDQEAVYEFRELINSRTKKQIDLINVGRANEINIDEQIVYLGTETDDIFELYFAPFGGNSNVWDETYNPYCKYIRALSQSDDYITFAWVNPKFDNSSTLICTIEDMLAQAYHKNSNTQNRIYILLPGFNASKFDDLTAGADIGVKIFGYYVYGGVHAKDMLLSYSVNGERIYVSMLNSLNIHEGSMAYQSNQVLIIKEKDCSEGSVYYTITSNISTGIV